MLSRILNARAGKTPDGEALRDYADLEFRIKVPPRGDSYSIQIRNAKYPYFGFTITYEVGGMIEIDDKKFFDFSIQEYLEGRGVERNLRESLELLESGVDLFNIQEEKAGWRTPEDMAHLGVQLSREDAAESGQSDSVVTEEEKEALFKRIMENEIVDGLCRHHIRRAQYSDSVEVTFQKDYGNDELYSVEFKKFLSDEVMNKGIIKQGKNLVLSISDPQGGQGVEIAFPAENVDIETALDVAKTQDSSGWEKTFDYFPIEVALER